jgi:hypothetical protein
MGVVSGKDGERAKKKSALLCGFEFGKNWDGFPVGAVIEFGSPTADQADRKSPVLKLQFRKQRKAAGIVGHPYFHPSLVSGGGAVGLAKNLDQAAGRMIFDFDGIDLRA